MSRHDLIAEIGALWDDNPVEGWNIADEALEQIAARYRSEFGTDGMKYHHPDRAVEPSPLSQLHPPREL